MLWGDSVVLRRKIPRLSGSSEPFERVMKISSFDHHNKPTFYSNAGIYRGLLIDQFVGIDRQSKVVGSQIDDSEGFIVLWGDSAVLRRKTPSMKRSLGVLHRFLLHASGVALPQSFYSPFSSSWLSYQLQLYIWTSNSTKVSTACLLGVVLSSSILLMISSWIRCMSISRARSCTSKV